MKKHIDEFMVITDISYQVRMLLWSLTLLLCTVPMIHFNSIPFVLITCSLAASVFSVLKLKDMVEWYVYQRNKLKLYNRLLNAVSNDLFTTVEDFVDPGISYLKMRMIKDILSNKRSKLKELRDATVFDVKIIKANNRRMFAKAKKIIICIKRYITNVLSSITNNIVRLIKYIRELKGDDLNETDWKN